MVRQTVESRMEGKIRCDACPVMCYIAEGRAGACDRYANEGGDLVRLDPFTVLQAVKAEDGAVVPFLDGDAGEWDGDILRSERPFITAIGAGTTYPDYKPAPFIVAQDHDGVDMVTVVTEGIFSYCGAKVKIDTDRYLGPEAAPVRVEGEAIGHVMTAEYGSQMLSLGGVHHLTGGSKKEGRVTCDALLRLCNREAVTVTIKSQADVSIELLHEGDQVAQVVGITGVRMVVGELAIDLAMQRDDLAADGLQDLRGNTTGHAVTRVDNDLDRLLNLHIIGNLIDVVFINHDVLQSTLAVTFQTIFGDARVEVLDRVT